MEKKVVRIKKVMSNIKVEIKFQWKLQRMFHRKEEKSEFLRMKIMRE